MRHQKKGFKLNRTASHRKATMAALSNSLIRHKRITTTWTKARALRTYIEPIINRSKVDTTHNRRQVFRYLQDKHTVTELFGDVATHIGERPGGYTRIVKLGQRAGDSAEMAMIELVDYNDVRPDGTGGSTKRKTRRAGRRRSRTMEDVGVEVTESVAVEADEKVAVQSETETEIEPEAEPEAAADPEKAAEEVAAEPEAEPEAAVEHEKAAAELETEPETEPEVKQEATRETESFSESEIEKDKESSKNDTESDDSEQEKK